jgi:hypothetical protein
MEYPMLESHKKMLYGAMALAATVLVYAFFFYQPINLIDTPDCQSEFITSEEDADDPTWISAQNFVFSDSKRGKGLIGKVVYSNKNVLLVVNGLHPDRFCFDDNIVALVRLEDGTTLTLGSEHKYNCTKFGGNATEKSPMAMFKTNPGSPEFTRLLITPAVSMALMMGSDAVELPIYNEENAKRLQVMMTCAYKRFTPNVSLNNLQ